MLLSEARQGTLLLRYVRKDGWNLADDNNTRLCSRKMGWLVWFSRLKMSYRRKLGTFWYFFSNNSAFYYHTGTISASSRLGQDGRNTKLTLVVPQNRGTNLGGRFALVVD